MWVHTCTCTCLHTYIKEVMVKWLQFLHVSSYISVRYWRHQDYVVPETEWWLSIVEWYGENYSTWRETCLSAIIPTKNHTGTGFGMNSTSKVQRQQLMTWATTWSLYIWQLQSPQLIIQNIHIAVSTLFLEWNLIKFQQTWNWNCAVKSEIPEISNFEEGRWIMVCVIVSSGRLYAGKSDIHCYATSTIIQTSTDTLKNGTDHYSAVCLVHCWVVTID